MSNTKKLPIKITNMNLVATWEFNADSRQCTICKKLLIAPSPVELTSKAKQVVVDGKIVVGKCKHMFHKECMDSYLKSGSVSCPTDGTPWQVSETTSSGVVLTNNTHMNVFVN